MCRTTQTLFTSDSAAIEEELRGAAQQYVRKILRVEWSWTGSPAK
jgi:hypothetical protein